MATEIKVALNFTVLVNAAPFSQQGSTSAYHFCRAALAKKQRIARVFFYGDGVLNANSFITPPQDEFNIVQAWQALAEKHGVELVVCIAAATRRGLLDANLAAGFKLSGLGQLAEAITQSDRLITFN